MDFDEINRKVHQFIDDRIAEFEECNPTALVEIFENPKYALKLEEFLEKVAIDVDGETFTKRINEHFKKIGFDSDVDVGKIFDESLCVRLVMQPFLVDAIKEYVGYQE